VHWEKAMGATADVLMPKSIEGMKVMAAPLTWLKPTWPY